MMNERPVLTSLPWTHLNKLNTPRIPSLNPIEFSIRRIKLYSHDQLRHSQRIIQTSRDCFLKQLGAEDVGFVGGFVEVIVGGRCGGLFGGEGEEVGS